MTDFVFQEMFPLGEDKTEYRLVTDEHVSQGTYEGVPLIQIAPEGLIRLAEEAFRDVSHFLRNSHLVQLKEVINDPESSENDRYVVLDLLKNAVISAEGEFPMCQDTGTAVVIGKKGQRVWTGCSDEKAIAEGVFNAYRKHNLRYSQLAPFTLFEEKNTGNNLPAQVELYAVDGDEYQFLFIAKGGGSANKTRLFQETKAVLTPGKLTNFVKEKMKTIGTSGCPPYHLSVVIGGTSAEANLKTVKLATAKCLDTLPTKGSEGAHAFRDLNFEAELLDISRELGIGAQFGGKYFCLDVRVIRLPRHGASMPIGIGVSCSADRHIKAKITKKGIFLEKLESNPSRFLPTDVDTDESAVRVDLDSSMDDIRATLGKYPVATRLLLTGKIVVARDIAHAKLQERLEQGEDLPAYFKDHIIYYAGPAKTPTGYPSGSFGPTTAERMDPYVAGFQKKSGSLVMLAKGNRSKSVTQSCKQFGGFYLGSIGGPAARLGKECITHIETIEYPELGMEAIFRITVKDFPAFIIIDDKGNDFFEGLIH
ncbi:MAG: fumarate hydratase [Deltaproteobacteria bacterium]|nr:fumarate hydratase [Deltaproteobacteria bacterium]MBW1846439.1 fumarate hydratase [Deltaproteobacteria bacterium]MBW2179922.1 fumarate hydratase [Deltaproteobacteria bacterium]MBW2364450.1 fumarate hydratase [Deltaproteobacteria bacterium]